MSTTTIPAAAASVTGADFLDYLTSVDDAVIALNVMRELPAELDPVGELAGALERVIDAVRRLDGIPAAAAVDLLQSIAATPAARS